MKRLLSLLAVFALAGCGNKPVAPDWQANAHGALERYEKAFLAGNTRVADAEFGIARRELSATGDAGLVARAELTRCALQVAVLVFEDCAGFEALRSDAPAAERAYADYLLGKSTQVEQLPAQHRAVAQGGGDAAVAAVADPVARLVAAGVVFRANRANPQLLQTAADTASTQGWRRALLAWLGAQLRLAEQRGDAAQADRLRRRIALATTQ